MASLAERLTVAPDYARPGPRCKVDRFLRTLDDPADVDAFLDAVERIRADRARGDQAHTVSWLVRVVDDDGITRQSLNRHVNRECACPS